MHTQVAQLSIPVLMLNNTMVNNKNILQQCVNFQPGTKKLKTSKYEKNESLLLQWVMQKQALNIPIPRSSVEIEV
jgi:hypothetical protein